jgi:hypothetical protein
MHFWLYLIIPSLIVGALCGLFAKRKVLGVLLALGIPWIGLLSFLLYNEYFVPHKGGGASMWPIAQIVGGTIAAISGFISFLLIRFLRQRA